MKKVLLGVAGLVAAMSLAAPAVAADLPAAPYVKAPSMIPALYDWSGFYIGLNAGGGSAHKCWDLTNNLGAFVGPFREGCHNATGGWAGGRIGYRWQAASWVFGAEAQGDGADLKGSNISQFPPFAFGSTNQTKINSLGLFTGQVGYAWNNVLWYVKGGAAVVDDRFNGIVTGSNVFFDAATNTRWGGTIGTGVEISFAPNWSVGFEYDHLFMGSRTVVFSNTATGALSRWDNIKQDVDIGSVRVNYRWGGPVIGKY